MAKIRINNLQTAASWCGLGALAVPVCSGLLVLLCAGAAREATAAALCSLAAAALQLGLPFWLLVGGPLGGRLPVVGRKIAQPGFYLPVFFCASVLAGLAGGLLRGLGGAADATTLPEGGALAVSFLTLCVVPAVGEELLFRGAMQTLLCPYGSAAAICGQALLFGLLHGSPAACLSAFLLGLVLGWVAETTGGLRTGMLLHFCNNSVAFLQLFLQQRLDTVFLLSLTVLLLAGAVGCFVWLLVRLRQGGLPPQLRPMRPGAAWWEALRAPGYLLAVVCLLGVRLVELLI